MIYYLLECDIGCSSCTDGMASTCNSCNLPYINILSSTCICPNNEFDINYGICKRKIFK